MKFCDDLNTNVKRKICKQFGETTDVRKASEIKGCVVWIGPLDEHNDQLFWRRNCWCGVFFFKIFKKTDRGWPLACKASVTCLISSEFLSAVPVALGRLKARCTEE